MTCHFNLVLTLFHLVPEMPVNFLLVNQTATTVILSWKPPPDNNGIRLGYQLNVTNANYLKDLSKKQFEPIPPDKQKNNMSFPNLGPEDNQLVIDNLHPFAQYTLILQARTVKGLGDEAKLDIESSPSCELGFFGAKHCCFSVFVVFS